MATPTSAKDMKARSKSGPKVTTAAQWKKKKQEVIELPSGQFAKIRRPGMEKFLQAGFLPNSLSGEIQAQLKKAQGKPDKKLDVGEVMKAFDGADFDELVDTMDRVTAFCFTEPEVLWHKRLLVDEDEKPKTDEKGRELTEVIPDDERDPEQLYTDEVDQEDKNFVFQYAVGGSSDLRRFREEALAFVATVESGGKVEHEAEHDSGS